MSSVYHSGYSCIEAVVPVTSRYIDHQKWAESDAEFVRSLAVGGSDCIGNDRRRLRQKPALVDCYSCRQMYLRSYTFSRKETVQEKTVKCLGKVRAKSTDLLGINLDRSDSGDGFRYGDDDYMMTSKKKKKGRSLILSTILCLRSCTARFDAMDAGRWSMLCSVSFKSKGASPSPFGCKPTLHMEVGSLGSGISSCYRLLRSKIQAFSSR